MPGSHIAEAAVADLASRCSFPHPATAGRVALAVSGGPDSLALLILAAQVGLDAVAIHVDHGLRPDSEREAGVVAGVARRYGVAFEAKKVQVAPGPDLEARARLARYAVLPRGVMTGHTMDDQAETVILNMLRGAGLDGLCGMQSAASDATVAPGAESSIQLAGGGSPAAVRRPLLNLRRAETSALCAAAGLEPVTDPTNRDPRFRRNRIRYEVLPLLCEVAGRDVVPILARQATLLEVDRAYLEGLARPIDPTDTRALRSAPAALATRALRRWLRSPVLAGPEQHPPSAADICRVMNVVMGGAKACELSGGRRIERSRGWLRAAGVFPVPGR